VFGGRYTLRSGLTAGRELQGAPKRWSRRTQRFPPRAGVEARSEQHGVLFPGRIREARRCSHLDHDPRLPLWNGRLRGIRAYWNPDEKQIYALRVKEHIVRLRNSSKIMLMAELPSVEEFTEIVLEVLRRQPLHRRRLLRPSVYKSTEAIGVKLHGLTHDFYVLSIPMGDYIDTEKGIPTGTVSWRRTSDVSMPSRSKITGSYVNPAFSRRRRCSTASMRPSSSPTMARSRGFRREPVHGSRRCPDHAFGHRGHPRGDKPEPA